MGGGGLFRALVSHSGPPKIQTPTPHPPERPPPTPTWGVLLSPFEFKCPRLAFGSLLLCVPHEQTNVVMSLVKHTTILLEATAS